jgi:hypothetical protein
MHFSLTGGNGAMASFDRFLLFPLVARNKSNSWQNQPMLQQSEVS